MDGFLQHHVGLEFESWRGRAWGSGLVVGDLGVAEINVILMQTERHEGWEVRKGEGDKDERKQDGSEVLESAETS